MTKPYFTNQQEEFSSVDLYRFIASDTRLYGKVMSTCRDFVPGIDSLMKALLTLGAKTVTDIALDVIEKIREENLPCNFSV